MGLCNKESAVSLRVHDQTPGDLSRTLSLISALQWTMRREAVAGQHLSVWGTGRGQHARAGALVAHYGTGQLAAQVHTAAAAGSQRVRACAVHHTLPPQTITRGLVQQDRFSYELYVKLRLACSERRQV